MPRVFGNEYRCALLKRVTHVVQYENSAALQNQECFVHLEVTVDRNACADHHLLGAEGEIVGACSGADIDDDLTAVTKMNELFAFVCAKHISLPRCGLSRDDVLWQYLAETDGPQTEEERSAFLLERVHEHLPCLRIMDALRSRLNRRNLAFQSSSSGCYM